MGISKTTAAVAAAGALVLSACSGRLDVVRFQADVAVGEYERALDRLDTESGDDVAALLDRGLLLSSLGRYEESNAAFAEAEVLIDDLYTRSLSKEALSLLTSDRALDYRAPRFEQAYLGYYRAWNYLSQNDVEGSLVEARKINERLDFHSDSCPDSDAACGHDCFLRYFSGLIFEWGGEPNDAYVAYKLAHEASRTMQERFGVAPPVDLGSRLARLASRLGFRDEMEQWVEVYGLTAVPDPREETSGVVIVLENGMIGHKREASVTIPIYHGERELIVRDVDGWSHTLSRRAHVRVEDIELEYLLRVAIPDYADRAPEAVSATLRLGPRHGVTSTVENLAAFAASSLQESMGSILVRTVARGLVKYLATDAAKKNIGEGFGLLVNLAGAATEGADVRSWRSLPYEIQTCTVSVPAGEYDATLLLQGAGGDTLAVTDHRNIRVPRGGLAFLRHRSGI